MAAQLHGVASGALSSACVLSITCICPYLAATPPLVNGRSVACRGDHASMNAIRSRPAWAIVAAACLITGLAMSLRQVLGLYLRPVTMDLGIGREPFSNAMAIANLVWGFGAILFGYWSDKYGAGRTAATGVLCSMVGFWLITQASTGAGLIAAGVLLGLGSSGSGVT